MSEIHDTQLRKLVFVMEIYELEILVGRKLMSEISDMRCRACELCRFQVKKAGKYGFVWV